MGGFAPDRPIDLLSYGEPLVGFYPFMDNHPPLRITTQRKRVKEGEPDYTAPPREVSLKAGAGTGKQNRGVALKVPWLATWGGDTSNVVLSASKLGLSCAYLTRVGRDPFGEGFIALWNASGIRTDFVQKDPHHPTGLYVVSFHNGKHALTYYRKGSAAAHMDPHAFDFAALSSVKVLHLSGISLAISPQAREFGLALMEAARAQGTLVSFDTNYRPALWVKKNARRLFEGVVPAYVDILATTDEEMELLRWGKDPSDLPRRLPGPRYYLIKQGAKGSYARGPDQEVFSPAFPVSVVDTVGAGDAFDAGFIRAFLHSVPLWEAVRYASAVAALVCTGQGPLETQPTHTQVEAFLRGHA